MKRVRYNERVCVEELQRAGNKKMYKVNVLRARNLSSERMATAFTSNIETGTSQQSASRHPQRGRPTVEEVSQAEKHEGQDVVISRAECDMSGSALGEVAALVASPNFRLRRPWQLMRRTLQLQKGGVQLRIHNTVPSSLRSLHL